MRHGLFGSLLVLLGSGVAALAQPAPEYRPAVGYYNPMAPAAYPPPAPYPGGANYAQPAYPYQQPMYYRQGAPAMYPQGYRYPQAGMYYPPAAPPRWPVTATALRPQESGVPALPQMPKAGEEHTGGPTMPAPPAAEETPVEETPPAPTLPRTATPSADEIAAGKSAPVTSQAGPACDKACDKGCDKCDAGCDDAQGKKKHSLFAWPFSKEKTSLFSGSGKKEKKEKVAEGKTEKKKALWDWSPSGKSSKTALWDWTPNIKSKTSLFEGPFKGKKKSCEDGVVPVGYEEGYGDDYGFGCCGCQRKKTCLWGDDGYSCCPPKVCHVWASAEALHWFLRDPEIRQPLLVNTTDPTNPLPVLGDSSIEFDGFNGGRVVVGVRFAECMSLEVEGFYLAENEESQSVIVSATGIPPLARPVTDVNTGITTLLPLSATGITSDLTLAASTQMHGGEANLVLHACCADGCFLNFLGGFRYLNLDDNVTLSSAMSAVGVAGLTQVQDIFQVHDQFYGGQIGFQTGAQSGPLFVLLTGKVALGVTHEDVKSLGSTTTTVGTVATTMPGGFYNTGVLAGSRNDENLTYVPEGRFEVGAQLTRCVAVTAGYTYLYWNRTARATDQIFAVTGATSAPPPINESSFWIHGAMPDSPFAIDRYGSCRFTFAAHCTALRGTATRFLAG